MATICFSQGKLASKLLAKVAMKVGDASTLTTSTLDDVTLTVGIGSNLHPAELGTVAQSFFPGWITGGDQTVVMVTKKNQPGLCKVDGTVTIDGAPVEYISVGTYSLITASNPAPRKIQITTSSGQQSSFTIAPNTKRLKVLSINGQKDNVSLDLTKDVVVELDVTQVPANTMLKVSLAINQVSLKSQYDVCYLRSGSTITIPAAAFRNINIAPAGGAVYSYKNSFLSVGVDEMIPATDVSGSFSTVLYTSYYSDGKFVTVSTEPDLNTGLVAKGDVKLPAGSVDYDFFKPNASTSRPASHIKTIGILSYGISGKTYVEKSVITQEQNDAANEAQITKTTTIEFPKQTDGTWAAALEKLYPELIAIVQAEFGATMVPGEVISKAKGYQDIARYSTPNTNTATDFSIAGANVKVLTNLPFHESYGINAANERIMKESGTDALIRFSLDLQLDEDNEMGVLVPTLTFEIAGKINGLTANTKYVSGKVVGKGIRSEKIGFMVVHSSTVSVMSDNKGRNSTKVYQTVGELSAEELDQLIRRADLLTTFSTGLKEIMAKEKANTDYLTVWNLQN